jgi:trehalose/maltose hydrolase-like predicted phosphorylase
MELKVGQEVLNHLTKASELLGSLNESNNVNYGWITVNSKQGVWNHTKEEVDQMAAVLLEGGFELEKTDRESYRIEKSYVVPGTQLGIRLSYRPTEEDELELMKEKAEKAKQEYEALQKKQAELLAKRLVNVEMEEGA